MNNWNHLAADAIATNTDPVFGGIIDKSFATGEWFVIPNSDDIPTMEGFATKQEAFDALEKAITETYDLG